MTKQKKTTTTSTTAAVEPKVKTQTLREFRAWLSGVEEMQSDDWSPDLTQWRRIRERIENISEPKNSFKSGGTGPSDEDFHPVAPMPVRASGPSAFAAPAVLMAPPAPLPTFMNTSGVEGARVKTPNVDSSSGQFTSSLE
jgi:hypothetical protein